MRARLGDAFRAIAAAIVGVVRRPWPVPVRNGVVFSLAGFVLAQVALVRSGWALVGLIAGALLAIAFAEFERYLQGTLTRQYHTQILTDPNLAAVARAHADAERAASEGAGPIIVVPTRSEK